MRLFKRLPAPLLLGLAILALMAAFAIAPGAFTPYDPLGFDFSALLAAPSLAHPFGTDQFGRDLLARSISATAIDLQIALFATIFPGLLGTLIGLLVGWYGGLVDALFGRLVDLVVTFPFLVLVIAIVAVLYALFIITRVLIFGVDTPGYASLLIAVLLMGAIQLLSLGIIGEYLGRLFVEVKGRPIYIVEGVYEDGTAEPPKP